MLMLMMLEIEIERSVRQVRLLSCFKPTHPHRVINGQISPPSKHPNTTVCVCELTTSALQCIMSICVLIQLTLLSAWLIIEFTKSE